MSRTTLRRSSKIDHDVHEELERRRIKYGGEVTRTFLRPTLITAKQFSRLQWACNVLVRSVNTILDNIYGGNIERMGRPSAYPARRSSSRRSIQATIFWWPSIVWTPSSEGDMLTFLEFNCDSPAGVAYGDHLAEVLCETPFFKEFESRYPVRAFLARRRCSKPFRTSTDSGAGRRPCGLPLWTGKTCPTSPEFDLLKAFFHDNGVPCVIGDPRDAFYDGKRLFFNGDQVNFVYKRVIVSELLARKDEVAPYLNAYREHAACFVNSFRSRLPTTR